MDRIRKPIELRLKVSQIKFQILEKLSNKRGRIVSLFREPTGRGFVEFAVGNYRKRIEKDVKESFREAAVGVLLLRKGIIVIVVVVVVVVVVVNSINCWCYNWYRTVVYICTSRSRCVGYNQEHQQMRK